jgi:hypothetical protein
MLELRGFFFFSRCWARSRAMSKREIKERKKEQDVKKRKGNIKLMKMGEVA